jgi:hypothetical protein
MKLLIMYSFRFSRQFLRLTSKYFPRHPVPKYPNLCSFHSVTDQVSHPYKTTG